LCARFVGVVNDSLKQGGSTPETRWAVSDVVCSKNQPPDSVRVVIDDLFNGVEVVTTLLNEERL
jgi:hypothetical protein